MDSADYRGEAMDWKHLLAYITGTVDQELLLRNEYLVTENRILRNQLKGRLRLSDGERKTLAVIGQKLGKQALKGVAQIVKPETILGWHRTLVAQKFGSTEQRYVKFRSSTKVYETLVKTHAISPRTRVVGSIGTENRLKGDHPTARPQDLSDFEGVGALRASRPQAG
jgi:hypothetical protein